MIEQKTTVTAIVGSGAFWGFTLAEVDTLVRIGVGVATFVSLCLLCAVYLKKLRAKP